MMLPLTIADATCTFCGCVCDDIRLSANGGRITRAENACTLGEAWFLDHRPSDAPAARVLGQPTDLGAALDRAADILASARHPLIYGLTFATCQAQRLAVALADRIGASIDSAASVCHAPTAMAMQEVGQPTCTLGEVRNRADLVVYWGVNPLESHPRHIDRYVGAAEIIVIDVRSTPTAKAASQAILIKPRSDFELAWALRALVKGVKVDPSIEGVTGVSLDRLAALAARMTASRFGNIFFGMGLSMSRGKHRNVQAVFELTRDLNSETRRFDAKPMRGQGNVTGADQVLTWQTGFPFAVNLSRGHPRYNAGEFTAHDVLSRGECDAALILAADPLNVFAPSAKRHLRSIPYIAMDIHETPTTQHAAVALMTAVYGVETGGTVYRMDDVPIALRPSLPPTQPTAEWILEELLRRIGAV